MQTLKEEIDKKTDSEVKTHSIQMQTCAAISFVVVGTDKPNIHMLPEVVVIALNWLWVFKSQSRPLTLQLWSMLVSVHRP